MRAAARIKAQAKFERDGRERILNVRVTSDPQRGRPGQRDHARRHQRSRHRPAHRRLGRRRAPHRPRDQEPADADPALRRAAQAPLRRASSSKGKDVFDQCTDTIIRQVDDIKRMVDEFSSFARMPKARPTRDDLADCVRQALFLMRVGRAGDRHRGRLAAEPVIAEFDRRLISQALTNVVKNAGEGHRRARGPRQGEGPHSRRAGRRRRRTVRITVSDNGKGFPSEDRHKLHRALCHDARRGHRVSACRSSSRSSRITTARVELLDGLPRADGGRGAQVLLTLPLARRPGAARAVPPAPSAPIERRTRLYRWPLIF